MPQQIDNDSSRFHKLASLPSFSTLPGVVKQGSNSKLLAQEVLKTGPASNVDDHMYADTSAYAPREGSAGNLPKNSQARGNEIGRSSEGKLPVPSAPEKIALEEMQFSNDEITFLDPQVASFDDLYEYKADWLRKADTPHDFFSLIQDPRWLNDNKAWVLPANTKNELDVIRIVNKTDNPEKYCNDNTTFGTKVERGQIMFATNGHRQKVYGPGLHTFWTSRTEPDEVVSLVGRKVIIKGIITIINLDVNEIAIAQMDQRPVLLLPGRHTYFHDNFVIDEKRCIFKLDSDDACINKQSVTIVKVLPHQIGFATFEGRPVALMPGTHVSSSPGFQFNSVRDTRIVKNEERTKKHKKSKKTAHLDFDQKYANLLNNLPKSTNKNESSSDVVCLTYDSITMVQIMEAQYGCAWMDGKPVFLNPGVHLHCSTSFQFDHAALQNGEHISFENLHVIQVAPDKLGRGWCGNKPVLIGPGIWHKNSPLFRFDGFSHVQTPVIQHGSITRYQVQMGEMGFAWQDGTAVQLPPGIAIVDDPNFKFVNTVKCTEEVICFGDIAHVTTREGFCRPVYVNGKLIILRRGYRMFREALIQVGEAFPTGEVLLPMEQMEVLTRDRTPMLVTGQITYQIQRPQDLILNLGHENLQETLEKTADAALRHAFSKTDLSTISPDPHSINELKRQDRIERENLQKAKNTSIFRNDDIKQGEGENVNSDLCNDVKKDMIRSTENWGLVIREVAISDIQFKDKSVAEKLAKATSNTRTAEAEFDLTLAKNKIRLEKANVEAQEQMILKKNEAELLKVDCETDAAKEETEAATEAKKLILLAEAKRDAAMLEAEGLKALADASIARLRDPNVLQLEMMKLWAEGCKAMAQAPTPAIVLSAGEGANANGTGTTGNLMDIFKFQGKAFLEAATHHTQIQREVRDNKQHI